MHYSKYLKDIGMSRWDFFRIKHLSNGRTPSIYGEFERMKYGTNRHEMWLLDIVMAIDIYPKLMLLHEKYNYVCNFRDLSFNLAPCCNTRKELKEWEEDKRISEERFQKVLYSFKTLIRIYLGLENEEYPDDMFTNPNSQHNRIEEGFRIFGEGFWGVGI